METQISLLVEKLHEHSSYEMLSVSGLESGARTSGRTEASIMEMARSIQKAGLLVPIVVARYKDHDEVKDGNTRVLAFAKLGREFIPAIVYNDAENIDTALWPLICNRKRSENPVAEFEAIMKKIGSGKTLAEISKELDIPQQEIKRLAKLQRLEPEFLEAINTGKVALPTAFTITKLSHDQRRELIDQLKKGKRVSASDVREMTTVNSAAYQAAVASPLFDLFPAAPQTNVMEEDRFLLVTPDGMEIVSSQEGFSRKADMETEGMDVELYRLTRVF